MTYSHRYRARLAAFVGAACFFTAFAASAQTSAAPASLPVDSADCCFAEGLRIAQEYRVGAITTRRFTHAAFWRAVEPWLASSAFRTRDVGKSLQGRAIRTVTFGEGETTVLLWSQMHGDESTATMALADIFRYLATAPGDSLRERLRQRLTVTFIPMLNPDGAQVFQRRNAAGVDVNRDARELATPEARALKAVGDAVKPDFGFNLHDQNARTLAGPRGKQAAIALEVPAYSADGSYNTVRGHARLVAATVARMLSTEIPGRVSKYDETFNPRAFGDNMQKWGVSTVLIESGALPGDPEKQRLRALNVAAILGALDAIATGAYAGADTASYEMLPSNEGGAHNVLILGGRLALPGEEPLRIDLAIDFDDAVAHRGPRLRDAGDLREAVSIDTVDASGLFIHPVGSSLGRGDGGARLLLGAPAHFEIRRGASRASELVRTIGGAASSETGRRRRQ
ncbi:MAG TPA: M14 family zinc carboxypeptidase [Gemmatimonadaceae bacterium]